MELIVNATVRFTSCIQRRVATPPCLNDYVILHRYDTNSLNDMQRVKRTNYQPYLSNSEHSRLMQDQVNTTNNEGHIIRIRQFGHTYILLYTPKINVIV